MLEQLDIDMFFKMNINLNLTPYTKSNSKCYVKSKSIKFLEENIQGNLQETKLGKVLLDMTPKALSMKEKKCKIELHYNEKTFALWKKMKRQATDKEKTLTDHTSGTGLVSRTQ